jgi:hypothetical protein
MSNRIKLHFVARPETTAVTAGGDAEVRKLPCSVTRRAYARKPRYPDNGTPEERAVRQRCGANMHKVVFRSTDLILASLRR